MPPAKTSKSSKNVTATHDHEKRNILFFQPSCQHSQEFLKLLNFSKGLQNKFIQINVLTPNQKIPDKVQVTPTIFTVPDYNMYSADDAFKWLQQEIIKEQRNQNNPQQRQAQQQIIKRWYSYECSYFSEMETVCQIPFRSSWTKTIR